MNIVERWPIDFDALGKGSEISVPELERIIGHPRSTTQFQLGTMALCDLISRHLLARGLIATVAVVKGAVRVLTDAEASVYLRKRRQHLLSGFVRTNYRTLAVDVNNLTPAERSHHERELEIQGKYMQAIATARAQIRLGSYKRSTPGLPPPAPAGA